MPKLPINHSSSVIYKIVCRDPLITDSYIGATTSFVKRKAFHKSLSQNSNSYLYQFIRSHGNWDNFDMVIVENYNTCKDNNDLHTRERYWFEIHKPTLNKNLPNRDTKNYYIDTKNKVDCICGGKFINRECNRKLHFQSKKHGNYVVKKKLFQLLFEEDDYPREETEILMEYKKGVLEYCYQLQEVLEVLEK